MLVTNRIARSDNLIVISNIYFRYFFPAIVNESPNEYAGCVNISASPSFLLETKLKAHEAAPSHCNALCRGNHSSWAFISLKRCYCSNDNYTAYAVNKTLCQARCMSNTSLICGDIGGLGSAYRTGEYIETSKRAGAWERIKLSPSTVLFREHQDR